MGTDPEIIGGAGASGGILGYLAAWLFNKNKVNIDTCCATHKGIDHRFDNVEKWLEKIDSKLDKVVKK